MESPSIIRRRRPAKSCLECRRRKVRCNREEPCNNCMTANRRCAYQLFSNETIYQHHSTPSSSQSSPFHAERKRSKGEHTGHDQTLTASSGLAGRASIVPSSTEPATRLESVRNRGHTDGFNGEAFLQSIQDLGQTGPTNSDHEQLGTPRGLVAQQVGMQSLQLMLMKSRIMRWSDLMFIAKEMRQDLESS